MYPVRAPAARGRPAARRAADRGGRDGGTAVEDQTFCVGDRVVLDAHLRKLYPDLRPAGVVVAAEPVGDLVPVRPDGFLTTYYLNPAHLRRGADAAEDADAPEAGPQKPVPANPARHAGRPRYRKGALRRWREWVRGGGGALHGSKTRS